MSGATPLPAQLLEKMWFYVNFDCNLACRYCVARSGPKATRPPLNPDVFKSLVDEAAQVGFRRLVITGGEPLLNPHLPSMLRHAVSRLDTLLLTNATLVAEDRCSYLRDLSGQQLSVQVSLDGASPRPHDRLRGRGAWGRTVAGISTLLEWGFEVGVRATLAGQPDSDLEELRVFLGRLGVPEERSYMVPVARGGRSTEGLDLAASDLVPEPAVAADGLYSHPFMIAPSMAVTSSILPLRPALEQMASAMAATGESDGTRRYR